VTARYLDLDPSDRIDLGDVFRAEVLERLRTDFGEVVEGYFEENERVRWGRSKRTEITNEIVDLIIDYTRGRGDFANFDPPALAAFVDAIGGSGWEVLPPRRVSRLLDLLGVANAAIALTMRKRSGRTTRWRPRVKRLLKEDG
jgi:hypothetical protein